MKIRIIFIVLIALLFLVSCDFFIVDECSECGYDDHTITNYSPEHNSTDVTIFPALKTEPFLSSNYNHILQQFYFGTQNPPELIHYIELTDPDEVISDDFNMNSLQQNFLENNTKYYWRIINSGWWDESGDRWDTGVKSFTTCERDNNAPELTTLSPGNEELWYGEMTIDAIFSDNNKMGLIQCIDDLDDTLSYCYNSDTLSFNYDFLNEPAGEKKLTFRSWDYSGAYSEQAIIVNIPWQSRFYNKTPYDLKLQVNETEEYDINRYSNETLVFEDIEEDINYLWIAQGNSFDGNLFGLIVKGDGSINQPEWSKEIEINIPAPYGFIYMRNHYDEYQYYVVEGKTSSSTTTTLFKEQFQVDSNSTYFPLGYYDITNLNVITVYGCNDNNFVPVISKDNEVNYNSDENIRIYISL